MSLFGISNSSIHGIDYTCKNCRKVISRVKYTEHNGKEKIAKWRNHNRDKVRAINKKHRQSRTKEKIAIHNLRSRLSCLIREFSCGKNRRWKIRELIGCPPEFFKQYIESLFINEMTWENYGSRNWHLDHILPCASFDLSNHDEVIKCFHYTNLQPLWWYDNISKHAKLNWHEAKSVHTAA